MRLVEAFGPVGKSAPADLYVWVGHVGDPPYPQGTIGVRVRQRGRVITASWNGGPYVEVTFGKLTKPTEVINVWDDATNRPAMEGSRPALAQVVAQWMEQKDTEWSEWYEDYLENGRWDR